jgi:c-di-GMP-related signal transduction protein
VRYLKMSENILLGGIANRGLKVRPTDVRSTLNDHNIMLIIEKVETEETYEKINEMGGCDYIQGYLFGTPKIASDIQF